MNHFEIPVGDEQQPDLTEEINNAKINFTNKMNDADYWSWVTDLDSYGTFYCPEMISDHELLDENEDEDISFSTRKYEDEFTRAAIQRLPQMLQILRIVGGDEANNIINEIEERAAEAYKNPTL